MRNIDRLNAVNVNLYFCCIVFAHTVRTCELVLVEVAEIFNIAVNDFDAKKSHF